MNEMTERQKAACNETRADEFSGTDADARDCFIYGRWVSGDPERHGAEFDEWLARHDAAVRVEAGAAALEAFAAEVRAYNIGPEWRSVGWSNRMILRAASLRSALEGEHTEPKLDPRPWTCAVRSCRSGVPSAHMTDFRPGSLYDQDRSHYPGGTR